MQRALLHGSPLGTATPEDSDRLELRADALGNGMQPGMRLTLPAQLRTRSVLWISIYTAKPFALIALALLPIAMLQPMAWVPVAALLMLAAQRHFQTLVHDGAHGFFHRSRRINDALCNALCAGWVGMSVDRYRAVHMQHHAHNGSLDDPEHVSFKTVENEGGLARMILSYALMLHTARLARKYFSSHRRDRPGRAQSSPAVARSFVHIAVCQALLLATMMASGVWWAYPLWIYLAVTFNPLLSRLRVLAEHPGDDDTTVTTLAPFVERLYFAPQNFNYHFEHHAWPTIAPYHLAALHAHLVQGGYFDGRERNLSGSFFRTLLEHSRTGRVAQRNASDRLEAVGACPLCPDAADNVYWLHRDIEDYEYGVERDSGYVECRVCGLVQQWPRVSASELPALYPEDYQAHTKPRKGPFHLLKAYLVRRAARKILSASAEASPRILEVGCGNGSLLECVLEMNPTASATGVDIKDLGLSTHPKIRFVEGQLEDASFDGATFDVIYCSNLIEHVRDPLEFLRRIAALLAPGGRVIIETPDHLSIDRYVFGRRWGGYHYPRHTFLFDHHNIRHALALTGLEVERLHGAFAYWAISINNCMFRESARRGRGLWFAGLTAAFLPLDALFNLWRPHGSMTVVARTRGG